MNKAIKLPSVEMVRAYIQKFDNDEEVAIAERALSELFMRYPNNRSWRDILIKATALNSLYNTNIYAIVKVAKHIQDKNIDFKLRRGLPELVDEIAYIEIDGKPRRNYSFASKYCHWHQPELYPIYDTIVDKLLWAYNNQRKFMIFKRSDLRRYSRYKEIFMSFRDAFNLTQFRFRDLDKFLWVYGKELFGNQK